MADDYLFDDSFENAPIWAHAIDVQLDLARWWGSSTGQRYGRAFGDSYLHKNLRGLGRETGIGEDVHLSRDDKGNLQIAFPEGLPPDELEAFARRAQEDLQHLAAYDDQVADLSRQGLNRAYTYYVTEEILDLIDATAQAMPDDIEIVREMLPSSAGFVYFPSGILVEDVRAKTYVIKAMVWDSEPDTPGFDFSLYSDPRDRREDDAVAQKIQTTFRPDGWIDPPLLLFQADGAQWGKVLQKTFATPSALDGYVYDPVQLIKAGNDTMSLMRWLVAFWLFCRQEVIVNAKPTRGVRRRAERSKLAIPPDELTVRIVRLRKAKYVHPDGHVVVPRRIEWSHRWWVKEHQRRAHTRTYHRGTDREYTVEIGPATVKPYLKGPEHAPLIERDNVHIVVR